MKDVRRSMMHDDDRPIGRVVSRRQALALVGATATASLAHGARVYAHGDLESYALADCVAQPEQTEGPCFVDEALERSDIRRDPATGRMSMGAPLALQSCCRGSRRPARAPCCPGRRWTSGTAMRLASTRTSSIAARTRAGSSSFAGVRSATSAASFASLRSIPGGIAGAPFTFTSRCACPFGGSRRRS